MRVDGVPWLIIALAVAGCGEGQEPVESIGGGGSGAGLPQLACPAGERELDDGSCLAAPLQISGCAPGTRLVDGACRAAGIPAGACGPGFVHDGETSCEVVLPEQECAPGTRAVPGDTTCRGFDACGSDPFPSAPAGAAVWHVDASASAGGDGSVAQPFSTLQVAIDAAADGDVLLVAAGSYAEAAVVEGKALEIRGRCAAMVTVQGGLRIGSGADGSALAHLAVTGDGIEVEGAEGVEIVEAWLHGLNAHGVDVLAGAEVTLREVLIDGAVGRGLYAEGGQTTVERSVFRHTVAGTDGAGRAINIRDDPQTGAPATAVIQSSRIEDARELGIMVHASTVSIDDTLVRGVQPSLTDRAGRGINLQVAAGTAAASMSLTRSVIADCVDGGIVTSGAELTIEASVVRDVSANADEGIRGYGIAAQYLPTADARAPLSVVDSVVSHTHEAGIYVSGSDIDVAGVAIRTTRHVEPLISDLPPRVGGRAISIQRDTVSSQPASARIVGSELSDSEEAGLFAQGAQVHLEGSRIDDVVGLGGNYGRGLVVQPSPDFVASELTMASSLIEEATEVGLMVLGSTAVLESIVVRNTRPRPDGELGIGIDVEYSMETGVPASVELRDSLVEDSFVASMTSFGGDTTVLHSLLRDTKSSTTFDDFGDGLALIHLGTKPTALIQDSRVVAAERAGISNFGGEMAMGGTVIECAAIDLAGEEFKLTDPLFEDLQQNRCGCADTERACKVLSSNLTPPEAPPLL